MTTKTQEHKYPMLVFLFIALKTFLTNKSLSGRYDKKRLCHGIVSFGVELLF